VGFPRGGGGGWGGGGGVFKVNCTISYNLYIPRARLAGIKQAQVCVQNRDLASHGDHAMGVVSDDVHHVRSQSSTTCSRSDEQEPHTSCSSNMFNSVIESGSSPGTIIACAQSAF